MYNDKNIKNNNQTKICKCCGRELPLSSFAKSGKKYTRKICKSCENKQRREKREDNRFSNITFAGTYLAGIAVRNEQRKEGNLGGKIEKSPYSKEQEKLIEEYTDLRVEFEKTEQEIENDIDI